MVIQVSEALDSDTAILIMVERTSTGGYVDGLYVPGGTNIFKTLASVQPASARELQSLPEGERTKSILKFISVKPIQTTSEKNSTVADYVLYNGDRYKIIGSEPWGLYGQTTSFGAME